LDQSGESAEAQTAQAEASSNASINDALRSLVGIPPPPSTSDPSLLVSETNAPEAESAASADVGASEEQSGPRPGRRARAAAESAAQISALQAETERLQSERDAAIEQARADERARIANEAAASVNDQQFAETEARLNRLMATPDHELSGEDYQWREDEKARRHEYATKFPQAEAHYRQQAEHRITTQSNAFWADVRRQLDAAATLPGVDMATLKQAPAWDAMAQHLHAAGAASVRAELQPAIDRLSAEIKDLKLTGPNGLAGTRSAMDGGRSDAAPAVDESDLINGFLRRMAGSAS
jgi:hypothetical protein